MHGDESFGVSRESYPNCKLFFGRGYLLHFFGTIMLIIETKVTVNILGFVLLSASPPLPRLIIINPKINIYLISSSSA